MPAIAETLDSIVAMSANREPRWLSAMLLRMVTPPGPGHRTDVLARTNDSSRLVVVCAADPTRPGIIRLRTESWRVSRILHCRIQTTLLLACIWRTLLRGEPAQRLPAVGPPPVVELRKADLHC